MLNVGFSVNFILHSSVGPEFAILKFLLNTKIAVRKRVAFGATQTLRGGRIDSRGRQMTTKLPLENEFPLN